MGTVRFARVGTPVSGAVRVRRGLPVPTTLRSWTVLRRTATLLIGL